MRKIIASLVLLFVLTPSFALKKKIAVLPFDDGTIPHWWGTGDFNPGSGIANVVTTYLVQSKAVDVMEREKVDQIMKELGFQSSGMTDENTNALLGKLKGIDLLLMGKVTEFSVTEKKIKAGGLRLGRLGGASLSKAIARCTLDIRVVDVETGKVLEAYQAKGEADKKGFSIRSVDWQSLSFESNDFQATILGKATNQAASSVANFIVEKFGAREGYIIKVEDGEVLVDLAKGEVNPGDELDVFRPGEVLIHPVTGEKLGQEEEKVGRIKIEKVLEKYSVAKIIEGELKVKDLVKKKSQ